MGKSKVENESKEERRARKAEKKAAKVDAASSSLVEPAGVTKLKSEKKDKKEKKQRQVLVERGLNELANGTAEVTKQDTGIDDGEENDVAGVDDEVKRKRKARTSLANRPVGALVPFAHPLADEKVGKKVFKAVKRAATQRSLKRGVKEVVKALRKSPTDLPSSSLSAESKTLPLGIVILAADISPMDVISHIPVLCEDHNIPYIFVTSRAELGMAGQTKRPTSVVMISREAGSKKGGDKKDKGEEDEGEDWSEAYKGLAKVVLRETPQVKK